MALMPSSNGFTQVRLTEVQFMQLLKNSTDKIRLTEHTGSAKCLEPPGTAFYATGGKSADISMSDRASYPEL